jgi:hypothetical protein
MIFKIAYLCGIDMEDAMQRGQIKADQRFPDPSVGPADQAAYWQRFQNYLVNAGFNDSDLPVAKPFDPTANDPS